MSQPLYFPSKISRRCGKCGAKETVCDEPDCPVAKERGWLSDNEAFCAARPSDDETSWCDGFFPIAPKDE
jgi:hypothetical protein